MKKVLLLFICILFLSTKTNAQHGRITFNVSVGDGYNNYPQYYQQQSCNCNPQVVYNRPPVITVLRQYQNTISTVYYVDQCNRYTGHGYSIVRYTTIYSNGASTYRDERVNF